MHQATSGLMGHSQTSVKYGPFLILMQVHGETDGLADRSACNDWRIREVSATEVMDTGMILEAFRS